MFFRSIFVGFVLGMIYAGSYTQVLMDALFANAPPTMMSGIVHSVAGEVKTTVSSNGMTKAVLGAAIIFAFTVASLVVWPLVERAAMALGGLVARVRGDDGEWRREQGVE